MDVCQQCRAPFTKETAKFCGKCGKRKAVTSGASAAAAAAKTTPPGASSAPAMPDKHQMEAQPNHTLRPSASLQRASHAPRPLLPLHPTPTTSVSESQSTGGSVEVGRLSLNGRVGLDRGTGGDGALSDAQRRRTPLASMLAEAAALAPAPVSSTVEFRDPLTEYTHGRHSPAPSPSYQRGSTTVMSAGNGSSRDGNASSPSSAPPASQTLGGAGTSLARGASSAKEMSTQRPPASASSKNATTDLEVFDVEGEANTGDRSDLFMPVPVTPTPAPPHKEEARADAEHSVNAETVDLVIEPDPAQEAQYTMWATLGPDGITPEMLQTSNIAELRGWQKGTLIGRGTYGSVYLGLLHDGSFQAVKCVEIGGRASAAGTFDVKELVSLSREINMMQRLQHKNLCKFRGVYYNPQETSICMFMEYIGGGSVSTLVKRFKPLPPQVVRSWTKQLLSGLLYLHAQNIIHRDIKGDNVLVDTSASPASESQIKLVDFGAARRLTDAVSQSRTVIGTPYWMAPEVVDLSGDGNGYSYKADVWSVGCTVAEMLTGKPPWPTRTNAPAAIMMIASADGMPTEIPKAEASPGCYDFMIACFERDPAKRPTVEELLEHPWITGQQE